MDKTNLPPVFENTVISDDDRKFIKHLVEEGDIILELTDHDPEATLYLNQKDLDRVRAIWKATDPHYYERLHPRMMCTVASVRLCTYGL